MEGIKAMCPKQGDADGDAEVAAGRSPALRGQRADAPRRKVCIWGVGASVVFACVQELEVVERQEFGWRVKARTL
jgi:hypothetical protein